MLIIRLLFILCAIGIGVSAVLYLFTQDRKYIDLAWKVARFVLMSLLLTALLYVLERFALVL
jgi:hypothetical protein